MGINIITESQSLFVFLSENQLKSSFPFRFSSKSAPVSVNRSESYKETLTHARSRNRRKTSDPSLSKTRWVLTTERYSSSMRNTRFCEYDQQIVIRNVQELSIRNWSANTIGSVGVLHYCHIIVDYNLRMMSLRGDDLTLERAGRCSSSTIVSNISAHILKGGTSGGWVGGRRISSKLSSSCRGCGKTYVI